MMSEVSASMVSPTEAACQVVELQESDESTNLTQSPHDLL